MADETPDTPPEEAPETPETPEASASDSDAPAISGGDIPDDAKTMAMLAHLLGITVIGALIIWLIKKDDHPFIDQEGKEATNFAITLAIGYVISSALAFVCIGAILGPILFIASIVFCIMGAMKAKEGEAYRYPVCLRLIK